MQTNTPFTTKPESSGTSLAFVITSFIFLCLASLWLALQPGMLIDPKISPQTTAWLHLLLYGFALTGVFGLTYRALPLAFGCRFCNPPFVLLHLAFHLAALFFIIPADLFPEWTQGAMGQTFLACGVITFIVNVMPVFSKENRPEASAAFLCLAMLCLLIALCVGLPFAKDPLLPFLSKYDWSPANLGLCITGVVINPILALALRVTSVRLGSQPVRTSTSWFALAFVSLGTAWLFSAMLFGPPKFILFCAGIYLIGILIYLGRFMTILQCRQGERVDWDSKILLTAVFMIPMGLLTLGAAVFARSIQQPSQSLDAATVLMALLGVVVPAVVALSYQTVALQRRATRDQEISSAARLSDQILLAAFFNYAIGVCLIIPASWVGIDKMLPLGTLFLLAGSCGFLFNFLHVLNSGKELKMNIGATAPAE